MSARSAASAPGLLALSAAAAAAAASSSSPFLNHIVSRNLPLLPPLGASSGALRLPALPPAAPGVLTDAPGTAPAMPTCIDAPACAACAATSPGDTGGCGG